jgi:hypothetical protein
VISICSFSLKNIDDIVIFARQLWPKYDFNADLYLLQRKIWRDKKKHDDEWWPDSFLEAGNDEIQNFQREDFILWELHSKILVGDKNLL